MAATDCVLEDGVIHVERCIDDRNGGKGTATDPYRSPSKTAGIQEALDACRPGAQNGCTLILPRGVMKIEKTIRISCDTPAGQPPAAYCVSDDQETQQFGLVLRGQGSGLLAYPGPEGDWNPTAGTTLLWAGARDGVVLRVSQVFGSLFENFEILGSLASPATRPKNAGIGIEITNDNRKGTNHQNIYRNLTIENIWGDPGIGVRVAPPGEPNGSPPDNDMVAETSFENLYVRFVRTGAYQGGEQTANISWIRCQFNEYADYGIDLRGAEIHLDGCVFITHQSTSKADVRVGVGETGVAWRSTWALFEDNYHETFHGSAYVFCDQDSCDAGGKDRGDFRVEPTTFLNTRIWWVREGGRVIDYRHAGPLNLIGCLFDIGPVKGVAEPHGVIHVQPPRGASPVITSLGNTYRRKTPRQKVTMAIEGNASLLANDDPFHAGAPAGTVARHSFRKAGLVFEDGTFTWKPAGESDRFTQYLAGDRLVLTDGEKRPLFSWTTEGVLELQSTTPRVSFGSTTVGAEDPTAAATITLPAGTGTVLLDTGRVCGSAEVDPPRIDGSSTGEGVARFAGLREHDVCSCSPRGDFHDDLIPKFCYATADTLRVVLYNVASQDTDADSRTVDFCCAHK